MLVAKEAREYAGVCAILSSWAHPACAQARAEGVCLAVRCPDYSETRSASLPFSLVLGLQGFHTSSNAEEKPQCKGIAACFIAPVHFGRASRKSYTFPVPRNYLKSAGSDQPRVHSVSVPDFLWFPGSLIQTFTSSVLPTFVCALIATASTSFS